MSIFERGTSSGHYSFMSLIQDVKNVYVKKMIQSMSKIEEWIFINVYKTF